MTYSSQYRIARLTTTKHKCINNTRLDPVLLHCLLHFRRIAPSDRSEESDKPALVLSEVETKLPDEVFLPGVSGGANGIVASLVSPNNGKVESQKVDIKAARPQYTYFFGT
ncbi:hypothetical protein BDR06DRAFT_964942 [Suillus hirtellus]|nr:hypothetical protein BDR06DRAFT_964942 [Suillus hirtellus]